MSQTKVGKFQVLDEGVERSHININTTGKAVITKIIPGTYMSFSSTGADSGTGDVTINCTLEGGTGLPFYFNPLVTDTDPENGYLKLNNSTPSLSTKIYIDLINKNGIDVSNIIDSWNTVSGGIKGTIQIVNAYDSSKYILYELISVTSATGYKKLNLVYIDSNGTFSLDDLVIVSFIRAGDSGTSGSSGTSGVGSSGASGTDGTSGTSGAGGDGFHFENLDVDTGTETVDAFADTDGNGAVWQYSLKKSTDIRTGQIIATWDPVGNTVEFSELRTPDIGDTSGVTFSVDIDSNIVRLRCTVNSDNWGVTGYRFLF